jgi:signal peptidase I
MRFRLSALIAVGFVLVVAVTTHFGFSTYEIHSASMEPALHCSAAPRCESLVSDLALASRWAYRILPVRRGDIVIIKPVGQICGDSGPIIKRVFAIPGDVVSNVRGAIYVNGQFARNGRFYRSRQYLAPRIRRTLLRVPPHHYFVIGDNRLASCDSRTFGSISKTRIKARVLFLYWPLRRWRFL